MFIITKLRLTILVLLALSLSFPMTPISIYSSFYNQTDNISSSLWAPGETILARINYSKLTFPSKYVVSRGEYLSGDIISLYFDDNNDLTVKVENIPMLEVYVFLDAKDNGWLKTYCYYDVYSVSSNALLVHNFTRLNVSVYNVRSMRFDYLGYANGTKYWISDDHITGDSKIIIKISASGENDQYTYFIAHLLYIYYQLAPEIVAIKTEYTYLSESTIIHKLELKIDYEEALVEFINISRWWRFLYSDPRVEWYYSNRSIRTHHKGTYLIFFSSSNLWDYPWRKISKIIFIDSRGNYIPFEMFDVYYRYITKELSDIKSYMFIRNITIYNPLPIKLFNYPVVIELNESNFDFLAVNPLLSDVFFTTQENALKYSLPYYVDYWDGKRAIIWLKPEVIEVNFTQIKFLYGSNDNITSSDSYAKSLYVISNEFIEPDEMNEWTTNDSGWIIYTTVDPNDDSLYHGKSSSFSSILSLKNYTAIVKIMTSISALDFSSSVNRIFAGIYLLYKNERNFVAFEIKKNSTGGYLLLYQANDGRIIISDNSTHEINYVSDIWKVDIVGYINVLNRSLKLFVDVYTSTSSFNYLFTLNIDNLINAGRLGFYCANTSMSSDYAYVKYQNLTTIIGNDPGIVKISAEEINSKSLVFSLRYSDYQRLFSNYLEVETGSIINIVAKDMFGEVIYNLTTDPLDTIIIPINVHSFKIKNNRDDIFVHIMLTKHNSMLNWSEWLAPGECAKYILPEAQYNLKINYGGNIQQSAEVELLLNKDVFFMINGTVIGDILLELQRVNNTLMSSIQNINLYINTLNSSLSNLSINLRVHISNVNSTISQILSKINLDINNTYSLINKSINSLEFRINNTEVLLSELNLSIRNELSNLNSSINSIYIDFKNNLSIIQTELREIKLSFGDNLSIINSTIYKSIYNITTSLFSINTSINSLLINIEGKIVTMNTSLGEIILNISNKILVLNSTINKILQSVISELGVYNSTLGVLIRNISSLLDFEKSKIYATILDIDEKLISINSSIGNITLDMDDYILTINTTLNNMIADIANGILLLNSEINFLNETMLLNLYDMQLNISRSILISLDQIDNISDYLFSLVNVFKIRVINKFTGDLINDPLLRIYVNGTQINDNRIVTIANYLDVEVRDYWDRVLWSNITNNRDIKIALEYGKLLIINERDVSIEVYINPSNISKSLLFIVPPLEAYQLYLYSASEYNITIKIGNYMYLNGTYSFNVAKQDEPIILIKVEKVNIINNNKKNDYISILLGLFSGIGISSALTGLYKYLYGRRYTIRAEELLRRLIENDQIRNLLQQGEPESSD